MNHLARESGKLNAPFFFYEDTRADPEARFRDLLAAADDVVEPELLHEASAYASFENMRHMEESGRYGKRLTARGHNDPSSLKTRSGKIHGYLEELAPDTIAYVEDHLNPALQRYVYRT